MAETIVGMFESAAEATKAADDLIKRGFARGDVRVIDGAPTSSAALTSLANDIGDPDIKLYQEGVRRGATLLAIRTDRKN